MEIFQLGKGEEGAIISKAIRVLRGGGTVIYPTETCYGIGVDVTNEGAVKKLLAYKTKRAGKAILIAAADKRMAKQYVNLNETAVNLYDHFLPGPLAVVSQSRGKTIQELEAEDGTLGIRIPAHPFVLRLIKKFGKPITTTSANASNRKTPYSLKDILANTTKQQKSLIDLVIDAGQLPRRRPSTVVDTVHGGGSSPELAEGKIIREGETVLKKPRLYFSHEEKETKQLAKHLLKAVKKKSSKRPIVFALEGELGTGKTQFAKGLGEALGIIRPIVSPTFVLVREYSFGKLRASSFGKLRIFYHLDAYRVDDEREFVDLGWKQMLKPGNVIAVEWANKAARVIKRARKQARVLWIRFSYHRRFPQGHRRSLGENDRKIEVSEEFI